MMKAIKRLFKRREKEIGIDSMSADFDKVTSVIKSCRTAIQLNTAQNFITLFNRKHSANEISRNVMSNKLHGYYEAQFQNLIG